jgi:cation:H+ antiporter
MSTGIALVVFVGCLALMLGATDYLVRGLDQLGARFGLADGLLGLLTALGADTPEISSGIVALQGGHHDIGLGVVLGSNLFNLAALVGLGAVLAGRVSVKRASLALDGGVGFLVTLIVAALILHLVPTVLSTFLLVCLLVPYVAALSVSPGRLSRLPLPARWSSRLALAVRALDLEAAADPRVSKPVDAWPARRAMGVIIPALALIVGGSVGVVQAAVDLATDWRISPAIIGTLILAGLASLPNAYAAARLARHGRGAALVSETFTSNTINLVVGIAVPIVVLGLSGALGSAVPDLFWLVAMTTVTLSVLAWQGGLTRRSGLAIIGLYVLFVLVRIT